MKKTRHSRQKEKLASHRRFKRKLGRYRHTKSYSRISGGFSSILSFSQSRNRKLLIAVALIIIAIGLTAIFF
jgi:hypothetical protein